VGLVGAPGQGTVYVRGTPIGPALAEDRLAAEVVRVALEFLAKRGS